MAVSIAALIIGAGIATYGIVKQSQAEKAAKNNKRPTYNIPEEEYDGERLAESQASQGMSAASKQYYLDNAGQGLSATTDAILRGGGDPNSIGSAYNNYQKGINSLSVYDDQARQQHLQGLTSAYARMSADKDKAWQVNQYGPYADKAQAYAAQEAGAQKTIGSGISIFGQGLGGLAKGAPNAGTIPTGGTSNLPAGSGNASSNFTNNFGYDANNATPNFTNNYGGSLDVSQSYAPQPTNPEGSWTGIIPAQ